MLKSCVTPANLIRAQYKQRLTLLVATYMWVQLRPATLILSLIIDSWAINKRLNKPKDSGTFYPAIDNYYTMFIVFYGGMSDKIVSS